ncbi:hypothetical protein DFH09DRAFT_1309563 [Mycena vulgaris]|nr:hypothetical protein DFH09DRAFT_1309563 [Mycena vulgaris]
MALSILVSIVRIRRSLSALLLPPLPLLDTLRALKLTRLCAHLPISIASLWTEYLLGSIACAARRSRRRLSLDAASVRALDFPAGLNSRCVSSRTACDLARSGLAEWHALPYPCCAN